MLKKIFFLIKRRISILPLAALSCLLLLTASCSTRKNTAGARRWHAFTARYNTFYNGQQAFIDGEKAKLDAHKDDYTEQLPVFLVGNEKSRQTGKANYETAITKCQKAISLHSIQKKPQLKASARRSAKARAYLQRKEYNPFLKNAWLLMGEAQFEKGEFLEAAATFSYITRLYAAEPDVAAEARQWLARCYTQQGWFYDAEDALSRFRRDSVANRVRQLADATTADLLLRQQRNEEAIPYLERAARYARGSHRQARLYFLLGQVEHGLGHSDRAYRAFGRCLRKSPPFDLAFNARIMQTEVMAAQKGGAQRMLKKLRRMARSENNKDYLDQVYYAMGNIHLSLADTARAIAAYERGREKSTRGGVEKGVLLLRLGGLYWDRRKFADAQRCYTEAIGLIDKQREGYEEVVRRSAVLDKLVPFTEAVALQDSLQWLASASEKERNEAIDRVIEALKRKEKEEREARLDSAAQARAEANDAQNGNNRLQQMNKNLPMAQKDKQTWYFYNAMAVMQGKQDFQKRWGKRKNEDNWRRSNRTVVQMDDEAGFDYAADDSLRAAADSLATAEDAEAEAADSLAEDPHTREYYLKQIPFSEEARAASDEIIKDGLFNAGIIEKDDLEDFPLAARTLRRLTDNYTDFDRMAEAWYHLFLLYSRAGQTDLAEMARSRMAELYPENELTKLITAPDFEYMARYGKQLEDSLYAATYDAYRLRHFDAVEQNFRVSTEKFPTGANRPKFILVHALSRLRTASTQELLEELRELLSKFPESDVSTMAGMIVKGLESGRRPGTGTFDLGSLWDRRSAASDSLTAEAAGGQGFSPDRNAPFVFLLAYPTDSIDDKQLLYEMAHFNFTNFVVRGFDMEVVREEGLSQFRVAGFTSFDEVLSYARRVYRTAELRPLLHKARTLLISRQNLSLLGSRFSFNDYREFYEAHFDPLLSPDGNLLPETETLVPGEEAPVEQHYEDEYSPEELERMNREKTQTTTDDDEGEWY